MRIWLILFAGPFLWLLDIAMKQPVELSAFPVEFLPSHSVAMTAGYVDPHGTPLLTVQAAGALLYIIPEIVIFFFAQRYFVRGIVTSGLKG